ncbi:MAG TPA: methyltransferase domain-containing protein [Dermatophilaceae bacterium]|nr:methyltransferase domain-containing protein [Dermatophilaceae bacterium]HOV02238.1 methyltransferase domain-containing protein [Dermatophilaceae bacterium]HPK90510.1 methyltransferase domain-containing protein [Dermatophilaceae bacterium]HQG12016.1 methyltransferase domain-containing protein [Dermatophilaceae bacterium]
MTGPSVPTLAAPGSLARSIQLFQAFRVEQTDPDFFYSLLARDSVREVQRWCPLAGSTVLDVGGGPGYFADAFAAAGARYAAVDPDAGELTARGGVAGNTMRASGLCLPFADGAFDVTYSSNVLEHVPQPEAMLSEMVRVTRPGGTVVVSWTPWLSPWGGHETSPWHYLGGVRAADRYAARHGRRPKNDFGRSLFACSAGRMLQWVRAAERHRRLTLIDTLPRYHPAWARWVVHVPGLREVVSWNVMLVVRPQ